MKGLALILIAGFILNSTILTIPLFSESKDIKLADPQSSLGMDLITALENRKSARDFSDKIISLKDLSTILWAADGVNRKDGKRTAPSAFGIYYINIYVASSEGTYLYDPQNKTLKFISDAGIKNRIGSQGDIPKASHVLILTAKLNMMPIYVNKESGKAMANATAGCIAENVYLAADALGIGTRIVASMNIKGITDELKLGSDEIPLYIMPLGYPK